MKISGMRLFIFELQKIKKLILSKTAGVAWFDVVFLYVQTISIFY